MLDVIKLTEELSVYTAKITGIDNEKLSKDLELNCNVSIKTVNNIGQQSDIIITTKNISNLEIKILELLKDFLKIQDDYALFKWYWTFISDSDNKKSTFHDHITGYSIEHSREIPQWSLVYYASFPDNLDEDEGKLFFRTKDGKEFSILPEEGQMILFPSDLPHKPGLNRKSTKKRIVFGANIAVLDRNKKYSKVEKTFI